MDYKLLSDELLGKLLSTADEQAFHEIYMRFWKRLFQSIYRKVQSKAVAEELVQNLFVQIWEKRSTTQIENLENYLQVAAKYTVFNYFRNQNSAAKYQEYTTATHSIADNNTEAAVQINDLSQALEEAMAQLPTKTREIFQLNRLENFSVKEVSERLNIPSRTIEYHLHQAIKSLRIRLKDYVLLLAILLS